MLSNEHKCVIVILRLTQKPLKYRKKEIKEMNDKVLAKGRFSGLNPFSVACYGIAIGALVACFAVAAASVPSVGIMWAFEGMRYGYYWFFIGAALFVILGIVTSTKFELVITESTVTGKSTLWQESGFAR